MAAIAGGTHLIGIGGPAAAVAAAAGALCEPGTLTSIAVETANFRFSEITEVRDVNLLPGAVKYGDLPALLALCAPTPLTISEPVIPAVVAAAYEVEQQAPAPRAQPATIDDLVGFWATQWAVPAHSPANL